MAANGRLYSKGVISKRIIIPFDKITNDIQRVLLNRVIKNYEDKCILEGYIKKNSCKILQHSSGIIEGNNVKFNIMFECEICYPVEGMYIDCVVKNVTKAGIRAEIDEEKSPLVIFLARDHHYNNTTFAKLTEGDIINVKVIGQRFELNDDNISVIAEMEERSIVTKPRLKIED